MVRLKFQFAKELSKLIASFSILCQNGESHLDQGHGLLPAKIFNHCQIYISLYTILEQFVKKKVLLLGTVLVL